MLRQDSCQTLVVNYDPDPDSYPDYREGIVNKVTDDWNDFVTVALLLQQSHWSLGLIAQAVRYLNPLTLTTCTLNPLFK